MHLGRRGGKFQNQYVSLCLWVPWAFLLTSRVCCGCAGIRTDPDEEMTDIAEVLQELEDAKLEQDAAWSEQPTA